MKNSPKQSTRATDYALVKKFAEESLQRHVIDFGDWVLNDSFARSVQYGHGRLRKAHSNILVPLKLTGSRMVDIAKERNISKNAVGVLAAELEEFGYVELVEDPTDGRAKILRYTRQGLQLLADGKAIGEEFEVELTDVIGERKLKQLKEILAEISEKLISRG
jgi:DNA-binding MarR family transcriptional regulator